VDNIRKLLSPPDPWKNFNIARESRHKETGAWFVKGNTISEWKGPSSLLWINGKRRLSPSAYIFAETDALPVCSGLWEERHLVRQTFHVFLLRTYSFG